MGPYSYYCAGYAGLAFNDNFASEENYTAYALGMADGKSKHCLKSRAALLEEVAQQLAAPQAAEDLLARLGRGEPCFLPTAPTDLAAAQEILSQTATTDGVKITYGPRKP